MKKPKAKKQAPKRKAKEKVKEPRQRRLPEMEDARLDELHALSESYVDVRDRRMALSAEEVPLKQDLLKAMKAHGKTHYKHNGLEITVVHENEKVKVKLHKDSEEANA